MKPDEAELIELAARISDGQAVDWTRELGRPRNDDERRAVSQLRLVESLTEVHRRAAGETSSRDPASLADTVDVAALAPGAAADPAAPARWGRLRILGRLGGGSQGEVYRAWDENLEHEVALKLLPPGASEGSRRFLDEARALARVRHANVITVHGADVHDGRVGLWLERVRGRTLAEFVAEQGRLGADEAALIGIELCRALAAVHGAGLVHRDVKAHNVMRAEGGHIILMDFGSTVDLPEANERLSGTPLYMAPETLLGQDTSPRSDLYSLGVLLFHLVTGSYPVQARTLAELRAAHRAGTPRLLRDARPDLPDGFVRAVERALAHDPAARFATSGEMERALAATLGVESHPAPQPAPRPAPAPAPRGRRVVLAAAAATLALAALGWWALRPISYEVRAVLYRQGAADALPRPIGSGAPLVLGDKLSLEFEASTPLHVYVFNEDERGRANALFPLPAFELQNPLPAGVAHRLPGKRDGQPVTWQVDTPGGREHIVILASPEPLIEFEAAMARLPRPSEGAIAMTVPESAKRVLRGIGGLAEDAPAPRAGASADALFALARELAGERERVRGGVWLRQLELSNPEP